MACYFKSSVAEFLATDPAEVLTSLTLGYASEFASAKSDQHLTWWADLDSLRSALESTIGLRAGAANWQLLLEFTIPRKIKRIDCILLAGDSIILLECKTGEVEAEARRQVEHYALMLHYFHKPSDRRKLVPIVVTRSMKEIEFAAQQQELGLHTLPSYWIARTQTCQWNSCPNYFSIPSLPYQQI